MNSSFLNGFIRRADIARLRMRGVGVYHAGEYVAEHDWVFDERRNVHSISKSFTSIATGIALQNGLYRLDDKIYRYFEDKLPTEVDDKLLAVSIEDLLTMRVGMRDAMNGEFRTCAIEDVERYYLSRPMKNVPGTTFDYDTGATYMLAALFQRRTGESVRDFLQRELLSPLGIANVTWPSCSKGVTIGGSGLMLSTSEMARFGQFLLQRGQWNGVSLAPADYIDAASQTYAHTPEEFMGMYGVGEGRFEDCLVQFPEVSPTRPSRGYGYQFWTRIYEREFPKAYYCCGSWGKWIIVVPELDAAVSVCAHEQTDHGQMIIEQLVLEEILEKL